MIVSGLRCAYTLRDLARGTMSGFLPICDINIRNQEKGVRFMYWNWGLMLMLFIMCIFSPLIVTMALKQTKQDLPHDDKKNGKGH